MRWLDTAPAPVQDADRALRHSIWRIQLPLMVICLALHAVGKYGDWWRTSPKLGLALLSITFAALVWPPPCWRLARAAHAANAQSTIALRRKLWLLTGVCYLQSALSVVALLVVLVINILLLSAR